MLLILIQRTCQSTENRMHIQRKKSDRYWSWKTWKTEYLIFKRVPPWGRVPHLRIHASLRAEFSGFEFWFGYFPMTQVMSGICFYIRTNNKKNGKVFFRFLFFFWCRKVDRHFLSKHQDFTFFKKSSRRGAKEIWEGLCTPKMDLKTDSIPIPPMQSMRFIIYPVDGIGGIGILSVFKSILGVQSPSRKKIGDIWDIWDIWKLEIFDVFNFKKRKKNRKRFCTSVIV